MIRRALKTQRSRFEKLFFKVWAASCSLAFLILLAIKWITVGHP